MDNNKLRIIRSYMNKLLTLSEKSIIKNNYDKALEAMSAYCSIQYEINQIYTDKKVEDMILKISKGIVKVPENYTPRRNTVLFYDGFGLDLRGWAASYVRAIIGDGYELIYVTDAKQKDKIPHILKEIEGTTSKDIYIDMDGGYTKWISELLNVFVLYCPRFAFFYTTPYDVSAAAVFSGFKDRVIRAQIDLTDHAFWVGINAADYFLECRIPGASNAVYERGVPFSRIISIDCCLYINNDIDKTPLPFNIEKDKYFFSGGALYKTLGDKELLFYRVVDEILKQNSEIKYLYAGDGDDSEIKKICNKYYGRAFHIKERSDFYRLIENCVFMLNTYPMFGGLMMRFAAGAGKVPLTLKHGKDHEGLLINQSNLGIEFDTFQEVVKEANCLISDEKYRSSKSEELRNSVVTEKDFARNIRLIVEAQRSEYSFGQIPYINTDDFRCTYIDRIKDPKFLVDRCIAKKRHHHLISHFPLSFLRRALRMISTR